MTNLHVKTVVYSGPDTINHAFRIFGDDLQDEIWDTVITSHRQIFYFVDDLHLLLFCVSCI